MKKNTFGTKTGIPVFFYTLIFVALLGVALKVEAVDLVVNGITKSVSGGQFDNVFVANDGVLTVNGSLQATAVTVSGGTISVSGGISANTMSIEAGTLSVFGVNNTVDQLSVLNRGILNTLGVWTINICHIEKGGVVAVIPNDSTKPKSGTVIINSHDFVIASGGAVSGDYAGNDPRGLGSGFAASGGGGYGGNGSRGYWDATHIGEAFGDNYSFSINMGGAGGFYAGGSITIVSDSLTINGNIHSNGQNAEYRGFQNAPGAGSGGGILIKALVLSLTGKLEANGGASASYAGGGGGGRIKVFYGIGGGVSLASKCSVSGANPGTVWFDAIPNAPVLISPAQNEVVSSTNPKFSFGVSDASVTTDSRNDSLFCVIEISTDNFQSVFRSYDGSVSLSGWSKLSYSNGDTATFTASENLPDGSYKWRAYAKDRSVSGAYSETGSFSVGVKPPPMVELHIARAVELGFQSELKSYKLQTSPDLTAWSDAGVVITGDGTYKKFYLPVLGEAVFYRLVEQ